MSADAISSFARTVDYALQGLAALSDGVKNGLGETFPRVVELIQGSKGRVIVSGLGKSGHIARKIAATLASTGTPAYFVHPTEASHGDLGMIGHDDVVLVLSWSGETAELAELVAYSTRFDVPIVAITSQAESTLARAATHALVIPQAKEACPHGLAPTTSTTIQLVLGDALAVALLEAKGFSPAEFKMLHPGGRLGALLKHARDLMHPRDQTPLLPIGAPMSEAIFAMTAHGFGVVGLLDTQGHLAGVITDGDLRRHMAPDLLQRRAEDVMTRTPRVVTEDTFASEALAIMQERKINVLFVVRVLEPVGIVHIQDILRAGVI